jgi:hypothetical protein
MDDMARASLDDRTADRLLSGRIAPDDAPPGYQKASELIIAAQAPGTPAELAQEASVVSMAAAATRTVSISEPTPASRSPQRKTMFSKLLTAKAATIATVAVLGVGTAAAASGHLPIHSSSTAKAHATSALTTSVAKSLATTIGGSASHPVSPHAQFGLCTAYLAQHPTSSATAPGDQSTTFKALIAAHGGNSGTWTFCNTYVSANHQGNPAGNSTSATTSAATAVPSSQPTGNTTGRPSSAPHARPSTSGSTHSQAPVAAPNPGGTDTANTASGGASDHGTTIAATKSHGASTAGSANSASHPGGR